ncbi:MAG: glycoside hydrolase [Anaerolineae bacterium]|nr:glycoside hydrolase [Anaerolineae bacterium]
MKQLLLRRFIGVLLVAALLLPALPAGAQGNSQAADEPLYVALIWHQHQPIYYQDPETGVYSRPWVRVHGSKDYLDMATILEDYPDVRVTFNYTPSLIRQIQDILAGAKDEYWVVAETPAENLKPAQKRFLLERFFDTNRRIIARFPRYQQLLIMRDDAGVDAALESWDAADFRDLQVLFNLAWTDPDWLAEEPLASLVAQGRGFSEADKAIIFAEHLRLLGEVLPTHARLQQAGQIEVTMTPFAHPILPLLVDSDVAAVAMPEAELPTRFVFGQDAVAQVQLGAALYEEVFGVVPRGMWPAEGSVSPQIVQMVASAGIQWIATDEEVLARSLPDVEGFTRDSSDTVRQADALYRPYTVSGGRGGELAILFRDKVISDLVGFQYSGMGGEQAAADLIGRLNNIQAALQASGAEGPHLVTILLDGENAWEHYENDGKAFLHAMYRQLSEAGNIRTVTPSEFLALAPELRPIENLWPGSWITPDFSTWIGEEEENRAWEYLLEAREALQQAEPRLSVAVREQAFEAMYSAEGSDWFWYYGADQDSGQDWAFDEMFRGHLQRVYDLIAVEPPSTVFIPVIPQAAQPVDRAATGSLAIAVDGVAETAEWAAAAFYDGAGAGPVQGLYYGFDDEYFYLRVDTALAGDETLGFYFKTPDALPVNAYTRAEQPGESPLLGFGANRLLELALAGDELAAGLYDADGSGGWQEASPVDTMAWGEGVIELAVPLAVLSPAARSGNGLNMRLVVSGEDAPGAVMPPAGPALAVLPDMAVPNVVLEVQDPEGDDHGPGTYEYPRDVVFRRGAYDVTSFVVGYDDQDVIFRLNFRGPVENDWGAPNGMGIHTVDVYIDTDGPQNGARLLLPGRNAALPPGYAWDYAVWAEGWTPGVYRPGEEGPVQVDGAMTILTNPGQRRITIRVSRSMLPGDPADWAYAVTVASQEGYPAAGVWRIREVQPAAEQWRIGGAPAGTNPTRLLDVVYPEAGVQEALLADYPLSAADAGGLGPDDFGQVPVNSPAG